MFAAALTLAMAAGVVLQGVFSALGPFLVDGLDLTRAQLGTLTTALYVTGSLLSPAGGWLVDHADPRWVVAALLGISVLTTLGVAVAGSYPLVVAVALVAGLGVALGNPVTNQLVALGTPPERQGFVTGIKQSGVQGSLFLSSAALPPLAAAVGWRGAVAAAAAIPLTGMALTALSIPPTARAVRPRERNAGTITREVRWLTAYGFGMGCGISALGAYLPLFAVERLDEPRAAAGLLTALLGGVGVLARIGWGWRADRAQTPVPPTLAGFALASVTAVVLVAFAERWGIALAWAAAALAGASAAAWNAIGMLALIRGDDAARRGRASGLVVGAFYGGFVVGPATFGALVDVSGRYTAGWIFAGSAFGVAAVVALSWSAVRARVGTRPAR